MADQLDVKFRLNLEGDDRVQKGLGAVGDAFAVSAEDALKLEKATAAAAVAQAKLDAAVAKSTAAQAAFAKASQDATASQASIAEAARKAADAQAQQAAAAARLREQSAALKTLEDAQRGVATQSKLTTYQTAQLSAQLQDLFVQIQAGGNPLTALIQQGSQLNAVFGGTGGALRAVASLVSPTLVLFGTLAGALGAVALAYKAGTAEDDEFRRSLILSGNYAGATSAKLRELAQAQGALVGTEAKASAAIATLAATGNVAVGQMGKLSEAMIRLSREGVAGIDDLAKRFDSLGKSPLSTLVQLNQAENFLTRSVYDQVRALEQQHRLAEAAALAQKTYADVGIERAKALEGQLGSIERGWRAITNAAAEAWSAMLNVGRQQTPGQRLEELQKRLEANARRTDRADSFDPLSGTRRQGADSQRAELLDEIRDLQAGAFWENAWAEAKAKNAKATKDYIAAQPEAEAARKKAIEDAKRLVDAGKTLAGSLAAQAAGLSGSFADDWKALSAAYTAGALSAGQLEEAQRLLLAQQPAMVANAKAVMDAAVAVAAARVKEAEGIDAYLLAQKQASLQAVSTARGRVSSLEDELQAMTLAASANISLAEAVERVAIARLRERQDRLVTGSEAWQDVQREIEARTKLLGLIQDKDVLAANAENARKIADQWARLSDSIGQGFAEALMRGGDSAKDYLEREFANLVLVPLIKTTVAPLTGAIASLLTGYTGSGGGTGGASGGGAYSWLSSLGSAGSVYKAAAGWLGGGTAAASSTAAIAGSEYGAAINAALAEYGITSGTAVAGGTAAASSSAAAAIPIVGWIVAALLASNAAYKSGNTADMISQDARDIGVGKFELDKYRTLSSLGVSDKWAQILSGAPIAARLFGNKASVSGFGVGTWLDGDFNLGNTAPFGFGRNILKGGADAGLQELVASITGAVASAASTFGGSLRDGLRVTALTDRDREGQVAALLGYLRPDNTLIAGTQTGSGSFGSGGPGTAASKIAAEDLQQWFTDQMPLVIIQGLRQSNLDARFKDYFDAVASSADLSAEKAQTILQTASSVAQLSKAFGDFGGGLGQFKSASVSALAELAQMAGGFDALGTQASAFVSHFLGEDEKLAAASKQFNGQLTALGLPLLDLSQSSEQLRATWRSLLDAQDLSTESGRKAAAAIYGLSDAIGSIVDAKAKAEAALQDAIDKVLPKYLTADQQTQRQYSGISADLKAAGVNVSVGDLLGATKEDIFSFAQAFVALSTNSLDAKLAVVNAAGALADLKDAAVSVASSKAKENLIKGYEMITSQQQAAVDARQVNDLYAQYTPDKVFSLLDKKDQEFWRNYVTLGPGYGGGPVSDKDAAAAILGPTLASYQNYFVGRDLKLEADWQAQVPQIIAAADAARNERLANSGGVYDDKSTQIAQEQLNATNDLIRQLDSLEQSLSDYMDSLLTSDLSPLSKEDQYKAARSQLDDVAARALQGDLQAGRAAIDAVATFLRSSEAYNARGTAYTSDFNFGQDILHRIEAVMQRIETNTKQTVQATAASGESITGAIEDGNSITAQSLAYKTLREAIDAP